MLYGPKLVAAMTKMPDRLRFEDEPTDFITVDLEVYSRRRLTKLATALSPYLGLHHEGPWGRGLYFAAFGGAGHRVKYSRSGTAAQQIEALVRIVRGLPPEAKALWEGAQSRNFDIGIQSGLHPRSYQLKLAPKTLAAATSVNATIAITVYAPVATYEPASRK